MYRTSVMLRHFLLVYYLSSATTSELLSRQRRFWIIDSFVIEEEHPGPFPYVLGKINIERSYRVYFELYGEGVEEEPKGVLSIHKESGTIYVHGPVDYEEKKLLKLKFETRKADLSIDTSLGIEITIQDINDNAPHFQRDLYEISVAEEEDQGTNILTVVAYDRDQRGTANSTFHYEIKSVSPHPPNTEFFVSESGAISFRGCLDHEVAERFTVLVEAKDHGEVVSLSSSTTVVIHVQDGNNHRPTISGQTGSGKVNEDETGTCPLRLHVTDKDSPGGPAWRVKYTIQGDDGENFQIQTDPDTNDGILTVVKPLDFEEGAQRRLSVSVENEIPYFSCEVKERTSSGLWKVDTSAGDGPGAGRPHTVSVLIKVEDTNDPPVFLETVKEAVLVENVLIGTWVEKVTAVDRDSSHARDFVYKVVNDPAGWLTVDPQTGDITTVKTPDRESSHVVNGVYTVILNAVDDGKTLTVAAATPRNPPLTGTATLNIRMMDQNDNVPQLTEHDVHVCVTDSPSTTHITAFDPDGDPFGGPFTFELLGDVDGKWKMNPSYGFTAGLVKEPDVYTGLHTVHLKISDMQGEFGVYNISVTACDCSVTPNCRSRRDAASNVASGAIGVAFASLFLLLLLLLLAVVVSCKKEFTTLQSGDSSGETLLASNIEKPGSDCKLPDSVLVLSTDKTKPDPSAEHSQCDGMQHEQTSTKADHTLNIIHQHFEDNRREDISYLFREDWNQRNWKYLITNRCSHSTQQIEDMSRMDFLYYKPCDASLLVLLNQRLSFLREAEADLDHQPHVYADEGDADNVSELERIIIPDNDAFQNVLEDLGPEFNQLASICQPPQVQN